MAFADSSPKTYLGYLAIPRIAVGYHFISVSWPKLVGGFLKGQGITNTLKAASADPLVWHRNFIVEYVLPHPHFFSYLVAFGEFAIGISLLLGCFVRISSSFGAFHNLNILLAIAIPNGGPQIAINVIFIMLHIIFVSAGAGRALGLDAFLKKVFPHSVLF